MKKIIILIFVACSFCLADPFCDGWSDGFQAGYCSEDEYCMGVPRYEIPICPRPNSKYEDSYIGGYNRAFQAGLRKKREDDRELHGYRSLK